MERKIYNEKGSIEFEIKEGNGNFIEYYYYDYYWKIKFEGQYLNGDRNGKGKEYDYDGNLIFEGEYLNGKKC